MLLEDEDLVAEGVVGLDEWASRCVGAGGRIDKLLPGDKMP